MQVPSLLELLKDCPKNWGRWGPDDEVGALNYLTGDEVLRGLHAARQGKIFCLQVQMCRPGGDPSSPARKPPQRLNTMDRGQYLAGKGPHFDGGLEYADDVIFTYLQGTTHYDALGHVWIGDQIWNGFDAGTTAGGLSRASVLPIAERGIVGRGVLLDMARHRGKDMLDRGETFGHEDLEECAQRQGTPLQKHDILLIRTGWLKRFYIEGAQVFYADFREPGLTYTPELIRWFHELEIPNLITDTTSNEVDRDEFSGVQLPLHAALLSYLGISFTEVAWLDDLADDCAADGQYDFLYVAAPLKVVEGTGSPANPVAIK